MVDNLLRETKRILKKYGIKPRKRLSQHFLIDERLLDIIVKSLELTGKEIVLEVGAGIGTLTKAIAEKCFKVIAVEIDRRLVYILEKELASLSNVEIFLGDFLKMEMPRVDRVFSNTPFSISSPLLFKLLENPSYDFAVLSFQKEFVERLKAEPGTQDYGRLTVSFQLRAKMEVLAYMPKKAFYPMPEVDAVLIKVHPCRDLSLNIHILDDMLRFLFSRRRKKVYRVLEEYVKMRGYRVEAKNILLKIGIDEERRVYQMSPEEFKAITEAISAHL
ncbi:MAG: ribosomal RNA small subunit methyltransferase A [Thermoprotei archaeon]|nr:MAG: ribosomal RNA small subunit methyltransferase A [Thermoprotei archaeon]